MKNIYFICNNGENHQSIINFGGGASEFLFYLTAQKISKYYNVTIINRFSTEPIKIDNIQYLFLQNNKNPNIENSNDCVVIVQRSFSLLINLHKINQSNRYILWCHDYLYKNIENLTQNYSCDDVNNYFYKNNVLTVSVSNFHKNNIREIMPNIETYTIYNSLFKDFFKRDETIQYDKDTILFVSSWSKGIDKILKIGEAYYKKNTNFKLLLLKPNCCFYNPDLNNYPFIEIIGNVKNKAEYCKLLQKNLCVVTTSFPETFGCAFSESLFLGVPVIGDNSINAGFHETVQKDHLCNFDNVNEVIEKIEKFRENRPVVYLDEKFHDDAVIQQWVQLLQ
jgi:hypothetical protein